MLLSYASSNDELASSSSSEDDIFLVMNQSYWLIKCIEMFRGRISSSHATIQKVYSNYNQK